jgi:hypothetical protein
MIAGSDGDEFDERPRPVGRGLDHVWAILVSNQ